MCRYFMMMILLVYNINHFFYFTWILLLKIIIINFYLHQNCIALIGHLNLIDCNSRKQLLGTNKYIYIVISIPIK